jgi:uncharacterized protein YqfA (UPF0365 family)
MSMLVVVAIAIIAVGLGLLLAYLPMRLLISRMAANVAAPIKAFIQRQRERRARGRASPDRRAPQPPGV